MTYIYGLRPNESLCVGSVSIGSPVLKLRPFETMTLINWGQGHIGGQRPQPNDSFGVGFISIESFVLEIWLFENLTMIFWA